MFELDHQTENGSKWYVFGLVETFTLATLALLYKLTLSHDAVSGVSKTGFSVSLCSIGKSDCGDLPPKTYKSNFVHHGFVQFGKQHSRFKAIFLSTTLSQQCYEVYFISLTAVNP